MPAMRVDASNVNAWVLYPANSAVASSYLDLVALALADIGYQVNKLPIADKDAFRMRGIEKDDLLVVDTCVTFVKMYIRGFRNLILWCQGIAPEESYMRNHSKARETALSWIERFSLRRARFVVLVSRAMKLHYEKKYTISFSGRNYIMPCFNANLRRDAFDDREKFRSLRFAYVGSLAPWQCFNEMLRLYKEIEKRFDNASLSVFTFEHERASALVESARIENYQVMSLPPDQLGDALKTMSFGFVLRDNVPVNRVATPTKFSSYLSCGVIPIFSDCLADFSDATQGFEYVCPIHGNDDVSSVVEFVTKERDSVGMEKEYRYLFDTYYSEVLHRKRLSDELAGGLALEEGNR